MSKFIDKLEGLNRDAAPAMGFHKAGEQEKALSMLVAVELTGKPEDELKEAATTGAAAGLLDPTGLSAAALVKYLKTRVDMPVGLALGGGKTGSGSKPEGSDIDFVIFDMGLPVKALAGNESELVGRMLRLDMSMEPGLLRSVHSLHPGVDAVLVDLRSLPLTIETLMNCHRVADFTGQHVVALAPSKLTQAELMALREAGVRCLVMPAGSTASDISSMLDDIRSLPRASKKKDKRGVAIVPKMGLAPAPREEDEGDGDDDE